VIVVGEEKESVEVARNEAFVNRLALFFGETLGREARNPGQRGTIGEAQVVGEGEKKRLIVGLVFEKRLS